MAGRITRGLMLALAAAALLAGCGGGGKKAATTGTTSSSSSVAAMGARPSETRAAVKQSWETFFDGATPAAQRQSLLQNGAQFASVLSAVNGSSLAKQVKAKVSSVRIDGPSTSTVTYTILLNGQPVLANAKGKAVLVNGTWKVGVASFCSLLALEGVVQPPCSTTK